MLHVYLDGELVLSDKVDKTTAVELYGTADSMTILLRLATEYGRDISGTWYEFI